MQTSMPNYILVRSKNGHIYRDCWHLDHLEQAEGMFKRICEQWPQYDIFLWAFGNPLPHQARAALLSSCSCGSPPDVELVTATRINFQCTTCGLYLEVHTGFDTAAKAWNAVVETLKSNDS